MAINKQIKASVSITGLVLAGGVWFAPVAHAGFEPKDEGAPKSGEDAGAHFMQKVAIFGDGCKDVVSEDGKTTTRVCPNDLNLKGYQVEIRILAEFEPKDNGGPSRGEDAGSHSMNVQINGTSWNLVVPSVG